MIVFLLANWKTVLVAIVAFSLGCLVTAPIQRKIGQHQGRAALIEEQALAAANNERDRVKDDARLSRLSDHDLCSRDLRSRGMPDDACASLLGVP